MTMDKKTQNGEALKLVESKLLNEMLDELENEANETAINAELNDDRTRRNSLSEVKAIRSLRAKLKKLAYPPEERRKGNVA